MNFEFEVWEIICLIMLSSLGTFYVFQSISDFINDLGLKSSPTEETKDV